MEPMETGVFSASLHPENPDDLFDRLNRVDLKVIQLALIDAAWREPAAVDRMAERLQSGNVEVAATFFGFEGEDYSSIPNIRQTGGFVSDYQERLDVMKEIIAITERLGVKAIGGHAGFIPEERTHPLYTTMIERLRFVSNLMAEKDLTLLLETGQETPEGLLQVLGDLGQENIKINFDPANLLLYGVGEPVEAVKRLMPHVASIHAKDATPSPGPDVWGEEKLLGEGAVDYPCFLRTLKELNFQGPLIIECEMGGDPLESVQHGRDRLREIMAALP